MTLSTDSLNALSNLAYLDIDSQEIETLNDEINSIIRFVEQLSDVDTKDITPLFHPMDIHQRLRADEITEASCLAELEEIAPLFNEQLYLVPNVMDSGK